MHAKDLYERLAAGYNYDPMYGELCTERDRLKAENVKLRELVRIMVYCMQYERECDGCRLNGADGVITEPAGCDGMFDHIRELGIEVPHD